MNILFVRHGQSVDDIEKRFGGWADYPLTDLGLGQAVEFSKDLKSFNLNFEIILHSPLKRATQVAEVFSKCLDIPTHIEIYLKERNSSGLLAGLEIDFAKEKYPEFVHKFQNFEEFEGNESSEKFMNRVIRLLEILKERKEYNIICVTHGGIIRNLYKILKQNPIQTIDDLGYTLLSINSKEIKIISSNGIHNN
jgi:2,3-bisphosphoglycerate-dependent phosphoglycerate mutase